MHMTSESVTLEGREKMADCVKSHSITKPRQIPVSLYILGDKNESGDKELDSSSHLAVGV